VIPAGFSKPRRWALQAIGGLVPILPGLSAFAPSVGLGCRRAPAPVTLRTVDVPLEALPLGGRVVVEYQGEPVEVRRLESGVEARNLNCTHFGCLVSWRDDTRSYHCSCHDGRFDAEGRPVAGPPNLPLKRVPAVISGEVVRVGAP
jgi:Rieske Fe-S protein